MTSHRSTAATFLRRLEEARAEERAAGATRVPMRRIFALAKEHIDTPPDEIERLLEEPDVEPRIGAVSIMDWQGRRRSTSDERREALYELYLRRHDRIDDWHLVDRAAPHVVGRFLADRGRDPLYALARSPDQWERRTAIVSTWYFIRAGDLEDTFGIAEILVDDPADLVRKAVGGWIREAGKRSPEHLAAFLDRHAATMPRVTLRYAVEHLTPERRAHYLGLARRSGAPVDP